MQIHEITKRSLQEGVFDAFKSPEKIAAQAAQKLQAQGYGQRKPLPAVQDSVAAVQKNPAQQQYIKGLVSQWQQAAPAAPAPATPATTAPAEKLTAQQQAAKKAELLGKRAAGKTIASQTGSGFSQYVQGGGGSKLAGADAQGNPIFKQNIKREDFDLDEAAAATATTGYRDAFIKWAGEKLRTKDPTTFQTITLDQVNSTPEIDIKDELDRALTQVVATAGDPAKNTVAVNNYLTIAVAGVARVSQQLRQDRAYGNADNLNKSNTSASTGRAGQAIVTQQEIRNKLASFDAKEQDILKDLVSDPASLRALLKTFGVQA